MGPALDVRFDIDKVAAGTDSGLYGLESWKVFWGAVDPAQLLVAVLHDGDTAATLNHRENVFCIEVEAGPGALREARSALLTSEAFRRVAANPPFSEGAELSTRVLADAGRVVDGHLAGNGWAIVGLESARQAGRTTPATAARPPHVSAQPAAGQAPRPAYGPPSAGYYPTPVGYPAPQVYAPTPAGYGLAAPPLDPRLTAVTAEYSKRRYKVVAGPSGPAGPVTMERRATPFNWIVAVCLFFLFGVGVLLYTLIWAIWGVHRTYRVGISLGPNGETQELGDVLAVYDQDRRRAHRIRLLVAGGLVAALGLLMLVGSVGSAATGDMAWQDLAAGIPLLVLVPGGIAALLFWLARRTKTTPGPIALVATPVPAGRSANWRPAALPATATDQPSTAPFDGAPNRGPGAGLHP